VHLHICMHLMYCHVCVWDGMIIRWHELGCRLLFLEFRIMERGNGGSFSFGGGRGEIWKYS
jgi:hypothetical protein